MCQRSNRGNRQHRRRSELRHGPGRLGSGDLLHCLEVSYVTMWRRAATRGNARDDHVDISWGVNVSPRVLSQGVTAAGHWGMAGAWVTNLGGS